MRREDRLASHFEQPARLALSLPSMVLALISSLSNSARPPNTVSINRPAGVVVSAHGSARDLNRHHGQQFASRWSTGRLWTSRAGPTVVTNDHGPRLQRLKEPLQLGPVAFSPADLLTVNFRTIGLPQLFELRTPRFGPVWTPVHSQRSWNQFDTELWNDSSH